jgi:hypothetical protein
MIGAEATMVRLLQVRVPARLVDRYGGECVNPLRLRHTSVENAGGEDLLELARRPVSQRRV